MFKFKVDACCKAADDEGNDLDACPFLGGRAGDHCMRYDRNTQIDDKHWDKPDWCEAGIVEVEIA